MDCRVALQPFVSLAETAAEATSRLPNSIEMDCGEHFHNRNQEKIGCRGMTYSRISSICHQEIVSKFSVTGRCAGKGSPGHITLASPGILILPPTVGTSLVLQLGAWNPTW